MRGLKKTATDGTEPQTDRHGNSMTELAQWGKFCENTATSKEIGFSIALCQV